MPRKKRKVVPEGNVYVPKDAYVMLGGMILEEIRQIMSEALDKAFDEPTKKMRNTRQRSAGFEQEARQPRLTKEADVKPDTKTRKHMEDAAADRVICGDSSSAQVDPDAMCLNRFGDESTEPLALPCLRDDTLVDKGTEAPKPCLSPVEMRTLTATGSLLPTGTASTATITIFH